ncbi:MAG TPA: protease complex subunit PrcB family protein [Pyrinomonadaceae bacterium]
MRESLSVLLMAAALGSANAGACGTKGNQNANGGVQEKRDVGATKPTATPTPAPSNVGDGIVNDELKVIAVGSYGKVEEAFVAVVRDAETYAALRELADGLPELNAEFFKANAVVAAFLGMRNTGGYSVDITRTPEGALRVSERAPSKGSMTTQALTAPFKIVSMQVNERASVSLGSETSFRLELGEAWKSSMRPYQVKDGGFVMSGGFAGRVEQFKLDGTVRVSKLERLITLGFDLKGKGASKERTLRAFATGLAEGNDRLRIPLVESGTLVEAPNGGVGLTGQLNEKDGKLFLTFEALTSNVSDGYSGSGKLDAVADAPPAQKKPKSGMREPL